MSLYRNRNRPIKWDGNFKAISIAFAKILAVLLVMLIIGYGINAVLMAFPYLNQFDYQKEYNSLVVTSSLGVVLIFTYLLAYGIPVFVGLFCVWVFFRELHEYFTSSGSNDNQK